MIPMPVAVHKVRTMCFGLVRVDAENDRRLWTELTQLQQEGPATFALLLSLAATAKRRFGKEVCVTDVWRNDIHSTHNTWRAFDARISNPRRTEPESELTLAEWRELKKWADDVWRYGRKLSRPWEDTSALVIETFYDSKGRLETKSHVHCQWRDHWRVR